jgi:hypothetical protein
LALALQIESQGVALGLLAVLSLAVAAALGREVSVAVRIARFMAVALLAWAAVMYMGVEAEGRGIRSCWSNR